MYSIHFMFTRNIMFAHVHVDVCKECVIGYYFVSLSVFVVQTTFMIPQLYYQECNL